MASYCKCFSSKSGADEKYWWFEFIIIAVRSPSPTHIFSPSCSMIRDPCNWQGMINVWCHPMRSETCVLWLRGRRCHAILPVGGAVTPSTAATPNIRPQLGEIWAEFVVSPGLVLDCPSLDPRTPSSHQIISSICSVGCRYAMYQYII